MKYTPHPYQEYCIDYLLSHPAAGLFLKPGMGKTSVALTAADRLLYDKVRAFLGLPGVLQDLPPPPGGPGKQMAFKILHRLFPPDSVAAALPVEEHLSVAIHPADVSQGGAPGFSPFLPLGFPALIPGLPAFLAGHKKVFAPSYR